jgi:WD40-like Beta Propeller Repeat
MGDNMKHWSFITWIILAAFLLTQPTEAQVSRQIIFLRANETIITGINDYNQPGALGYGDLFAYTPGDSESFRLTNWDYNRAPVLSPDGTMIAYQSVPEAVVQQLDSNTYPFDYDQDASSNIWLMDVATLDAVRIAEQQPVQSAIGRALMRSEPVWSFDNQHIAWLEFEPVTDRLAGQLVVYDRASQSSRIWATRLNMGYFDGGIIHIPSLDGWGSHIAQTVWTYGIPEDFAPEINSEDAGYVTTFINENGVQRTDAVSITLSDVRNYQAYTWFWAKRGGIWFFAIHYPSGWQLLNPSTGERLALSEPPLLQTPSGNGLRLRQQEKQWIVRTTDGSETMLPANVTQVALAPDGNAVAYLEGGKAYLWQPDQPATLLLPEAEQEWQILSLAWSPMIWNADAGFENRG